MFPHTIIENHWCCGMEGCTKRILIEKKSLIVYHKNTHNPKYKCEHCGECFPQKNRMEVHIRTAHTGEKPYKCNLCDKAFTQMSNLNDHVKKNHAVVKKENLMNENDTATIPGEDPGSQLTGIFLG